MKRDKKLESGLTADRRTGIYLFLSQFNNRTEVDTVPEREILFVEWKGLQRKWNVEDDTSSRRALPGAALPLNDLLSLVLISQYLLPIINMAKP